MSDKLKARALEWLRNEAKYGTDARYAEVVLQLLERAPTEARELTQNDKRWRLLEHGCQWVSWTPTAGETHSFDPRDVKELKRMRASADETIEQQLAILRGLMDSYPRSPPRRNDA